MYVSGESPCESSPCKNGGTCKTIGKSVSCYCTDDYIGDNCEKLIARKASLSKDEITIIIAVVSGIAGIIFIIVVVSLIVCHCRRKRQKQQRTTNEYTAAGSKTWYPDYIKNA